MVMGTVSLAGACEILDSVVKGADGKVGLRQVRKLWAAGLKPWAGK